MKLLKSIVPSAAAVLVIGAMAPAFAQTSPPPGKSLAASAGILAYPAKNQTPEQQSKDETECYNWSKQESGYDPMAPATPPAPAQASQAQQPAATGARAKGAVKGAAAGAIIGEVADNDASQGAAVGATTPIDSMTTTSTTGTAINARITLSKVPAFSGTLLSSFASFTLRKPKKEKTSPTTPAATATGLVYAPATPRRNQTIDQIAAPTVVFIASSRM